MREEDKPALRQAVTCPQCGHVTPYVPHQMVKLIAHHLAAVHNRMVMLNAKGIR